MADEILKNDQNTIRVLGAVTDDSNQFVTMLRVDPITKRLLVSATGLPGAGTVTSITQGVGILLSPSPITTTGSVSLATSLQPIASLTGNSLKVLRVNAGETAVEYATISSGLTVGTTAITSGTTTRILYDNAGVLGEYTITGTGTVVAMQTSPTFNTSINVAGVIIDVSDINVSTNNPLTISTNNTNRWQFSSTGHLLALTDNTYDIGATGATRPRTVYIGTSLISPLVNGLTITANNTNTLNISAGKTLTVSNTLSLAGTDSTVMTFPSTSATIARTDAANTFTGVQTFSTPIATGSVATMTATVGGGVPTPPNNTTTFLRGDGTFASPSAPSSTAGTGNPPTSASTQTITHSLGRTPTVIRMNGISRFIASTSALPAGVSYGVWNSSGNNSISISNGPTSALTPGAGANAIVLCDLNSTTGAGVIQNVTSTTFDIVWTGSFNSGITGSFYLWEAQ